jgi:prepilin-type N-terminal cleavage/methylation domain-containing protein
LAIGSPGNRGVTLIELSVALALLALALTVVWPRWADVNDRGKDEAAHRQAIELHRRALLSDAE